MKFKSDVDVEAALAVSENATFGGDVFLSTSKGLYANTIQSLSSAGLKIGNDDFSGYAFFKDDGNVGIGTNNPNEKLTVAGNIHAYAASGINAGFFASTAAGATSIAIRSSGVTYFNSGNVGIGATAPGSKLEVTGSIPKTVSISQTRTDTSTGLATMRSFYAFGITQFRGGVNWGLYMSNITDNLPGIQVVDTSDNAGPLAINPYGGNVGIGNTDPGTYKLNVSGTGYYSNQLTVDGFTNDAGISFRDGFTPTNTGIRAKAIGTANRDGVELLGYNGIDFSVNNGANVAMRIVGVTGTGVGNVGIGTTAPSAKLQIVDISNPGATSGSVIIEGRRDGSPNVLTLRARDASAPTVALPNSQGPVVRFQGFDGTDFENMGFIQVAADGQAVANADAPSFMAFGTSGDGSSSPAERMRIDSAGAIKFNNYGAGTLVSDASGNITVSSGGGAGGPYLPLAGGTLTGALTGTAATFSGNVTVKGNSLNIWGGNAALAGAIQANSANGGLYLAASGTNQNIRLVPTGTGFAQVTTSLDVTGAGTFGGSINAGDNIVIGSGGTYQAGNIYSDANWGMIFRALQANPTNADFLFTNSADVERFRIASNGGAVFAGTITSGTVTAPTFLGELNGTINTGTTAVTKANATNDTTVATTAFVQNLIGTIPAGLVFQGTWNAATNTPTLTSGSGTTGNFYIVSTSGSTNLDGVTDWVTGDWAVFIEQGGTDAWEKIDNSSVLDGAGTGQTLPLWSGSGTSNTLTDSILSQDGDYINILSSSVVTGENAGLTLHGYDTASASGKYGSLNIGTDGNFNIQTNDEYIVLNPANYVKTAATHIMTQDVFMYRDRHIRFLDGPGDSWNDVLGLTATTDIVQFGAINSFNSNVGEVAFYSANTENMRLDVDGNLGIGTTSPSTKLHVVGSAGEFALSLQNSSNGDGIKITTENQTANNGFLWNQGSSNLVNMYSSSTTNASKMIMLAGGVDKIFFNTEGNSYFNGGNVGIGTTSPVAALNIGNNGNIRIDGNASGGGIYASSNGSNNTFSLTRQDGVNVGDLSISGYSGVGITGGRSSSPATSGYSFYVKSNGNVGIGTTSPSEKLEVSGSIKVSNAYPRIYLADTQGVPRTFSIGTSNEDLIINSGSTDVLSILGASGNVGIGITNPSEKLQVSGNAYIGTGAASDNLALRVYGNNAGASRYLELAHTNASSSRLKTNNSYLSLESAGYILLAQSGLFYGDTLILNNKRIKYGESNGGWRDVMYLGTDNVFRIGTISTMSSGGDTAMYHSGSEKVRITSTGFGIGTTNPGAKLQVGSRGTAAALTPPATDGILFDFHNDGSPYTRHAAIISQAGDATESVIDFWTKVASGTSAKKMTIRGDGNVGIGTANPSSKLQVAGGVQMADDTDTASADKVGTQRYRVSGNNSYVDMCMQTGAATYAWINIVQNNW
jgi:hypothetical protein